MTPAEITKLKAHAENAKALMRRSATIGERAGVVLDRYEKTLGEFSANIDRVSKEEAELKAAMSAMGNAGPALDAAFQDEQPLAKEATFPVEAKPSESAHLHEVFGGKSDAA
jgi:hypothetical protein